jgi:hypothetical protein
MERTTKQNDIRRTNLLVKLKIWKHGWDVKSVVYYVTGYRDGWSPNVQCSCQNRSCVSWPWNHATPLNLSRDNLDNHIFHELLILANKAFSWHRKGGLACPGIVVLLPVGLPCPSLLWDSSLHTCLVNRGLYGPTFQFKPIYVVYIP